MGHIDADILLRVWKAERRNELETDSTALVDALIEAGAEFHTLFGEIVAGMRELPQGATHGDVLITRHANVERTIQRQIDWVMEREEALGRWESYEPVDAYAEAA
jgi:hypothetical protein